MTAPMTTGLTQQLAAAVDALRRVTVRVQASGTAASGVGVLWDAEGGDHSRPPPWIRADLRLAPGFSGGPLADAGGRLIGINTLMQAGLALAVPVALVQSWLRRAQAPAAP